MTRAEAENFYNSLSPEERQELHALIICKDNRTTNATKGTSAGR